MNMCSLVVTLLVFLIGVEDTSETYLNNAFDLFPHLPLGVPKSENPVCREHSETFVDSLKNFTLWAHEMWDATAKASTGALRGNIFQMGQFEECLTAKAPFETLYCMATVKAHIPQLDKPNRDILALEMDGGDSVLDRLYRYNDKTKQPRDMINLGWCVPASCTIQDLEMSLNDYIRNTDTPLRKKNVSYTASIKPEFCQRAKERQQYTSADYSFGLLTLILVVLVLLSTVYDYQINKKKPEEKIKKKTLTQKMLLAFSARSNFVEMSRPENSNQDLNILYGLRTIAILVIIIDHRFGTYTSSALINFDWVERQYRSTFASLIFHGDLFVDSFFLLSGLLVTYGLLSQYDKRIVNPGFLILLRYVRLTPVYAFVIFYYATVFNYTGNGPLWKLIAGADSLDCKNNWWTNLLYINNYVNADHMCMTHAWYLPCDFHYFIIAIGICLLIKKEKKIGLSALLSITIISMIIPFMLTVVYKRPAMLMFYPDFLTGPKTHTDFLLTYSKSHTRATPYFVGMFTGYVYYKLKGKNYHVCRIKTALIAVASLASIIACVFSGAIFYDPYHTYNVYESATYAGAHRVLWALGSAGLMYVASFGHATFIKKILCWSPWISLSKLQYGAYLIHLQFQLRSAGKFMNPKYHSYFDVLSLSCSDMVLSFLAALALYLMIEAPFRKIFKELLMPLREPKASKNTAEEPQINSTNAAIVENGTSNRNHIVNSNNNIRSVEDSRL